MPKFCQYCGAPLNEGARFCTNCGHSVGQANQSFNAYTKNTNYQQPYAQQPPQQGYQYGGQPPFQHTNQQPPKKKGGCGKVTLVVVLVLIVGAVVGFRRYDKMRKEQIKQRIELSKSVIKGQASQDDKSENLVTTSEDIDEIIEIAEKAEEPKKSEGSSEINVKGEEFFGVVVPIPDNWVISKDEFQGDSTARSVYFTDISYEQYIDYCKQLEALPGWEADSRWNVAHFPKDHNDSSSVRCIGEYQSVLVSLDYSNDEYAEKHGGTNLRLYVTSYE